VDVCYQLVIARAEVRVAAAWAAYVPIARYRFEFGGRDVVARPTEWQALLMAAGKWVDIPDVEQAFFSALRAGTLVQCQGPCGRVLPRVEFFRDERKANGLYSYCKDCWREYNRRQMRVRRMA
jgi:hypothetical protein